MMRLAIPFSDVCGPLSAAAAGSGAAQSQTIKGGHARA